jgi:hypothetical protein
MNQYISDRPTEPVPLRIDPAVSLSALVCTVEASVRRTRGEYTSTDHLAQIEEDDCVPLDLGGQGRVRFDRRSAGFLVRRFASILSLLGNILQAP